MEVQLGEQVVGELKRMNASIEALQHSVGALQRSQAQLVAKFEDNGTQSQKSGSADGLAALAPSDLEAGDELIDHELQNQLSALKAAQKQEALKMLSARGGTFCKSRARTQACCVVTSDDQHGIRQRRPSWPSVPRTSKDPKTTSQRAESRRRLSVRGKCPIFMPDTPLMRMWSSWLTLLVMISCVVVPLQLGFEHLFEDLPGWTTFTFFADACFLVDMGVNFRTAFEKEARRASRTYLVDTSGVRPMGARALTWRIPTALRGKLCATRRPLRCGT